MRMNQQNNGHNPMDMLLTEMRQHVSSLEDKLHLANSSVNKGHNVNEKIAIMKEYHEKIGSLNSCWRTKNRAQLVSNLQQENRQIIALEEENRQLRLALKEMEDGLHHIMADYRKVLSGFMRADSLNDVAELQQKNTFLVGVDHEKYVGVARAAEYYMALSDQKAAEDQSLICQLRMENQTLRALLHGTPLSQATVKQVNMDMDLKSNASSSETQSVQKV